VNPILALSTAWCSARHNDGHAMLEEIAGLGFSHVELSHGIRITLVPGILKALGEHRIQVSSTHNFCPLPAGMTHPAPNLFEPSAPAGHGHEQEQWLRHSRRTLDFAAQVHAQAVVFHLGSVRFWWLNPGRRLRDHIRGAPNAAHLEDPRYQKLLAKALVSLRKRQPAYWDQTRRSVEELLPYAAEKGLRLGFENREKFEELPVDADFPDFLKSLSRPDSGGYWHDTGHAELKERMGVITQRRLLEENAGRLIGFHLHDVNDAGHDHQPVGSGRIDFKAIRQFWQPHHLLVLELNPRVSTAGVLESKKRIEDLMG
jgi:sugar phosphate isomerase/epimerase